MSFAALRVSEPSVVSAKGTSRRLLSPALAFSFSYFRFLHSASIKKERVASVSKCNPLLLKLSHGYAASATYPTGV